MRGLAQARTRLTDSCTLQQVQIVDHPTKSPLLLTLGKEVCKANYTSEYYCTPGSSARFKEYRMTTDRPTGSAFSAEVWIAKSPLFLGGTYFGFPNRGHGKLFKAFFFPVCREAAALGRRGSRPGTGTG